MVKIKNQTLRVQEAKAFCFFFFLSFFTNNLTLIFFENKLTFSSLSYINIKVIKFYKFWYTMQLASGNKLLPLVYSLF